MSASKLEYIWLDGHRPVQNLRSKTRIEHDFGGTLEECPLWSFDGSSTQQAEGNASDCLLKPVAIFPDPGRNAAFLVMTEVLNADGTPHASNGRATIDDDDRDFWFGFEQEYFLWNPETDRPLGFPANGDPNPQGQYFCSVGSANAFGRQLIEEHLDLCLGAGIQIQGVNAEVAPGQWEFQIFAEGAAAAGDHTWVARYLLERAAEGYGLAINYHCKPLAGDWNGSGMHANFSNTTLRECGNRAVYERICDAFGASPEVIQAHIEVYGPENHLRLTGLHETQAIDRFSYGISDRGASIRIPIGTVERGWKGWLEDRRPTSAADPYKVAAQIVRTVRAAESVRRKTA